MNRSERLQHDPRLERSVLALLALAAISAAWLAIGLPGLPPLGGGAAAGGGQDTLVANLHAIAKPKDHGAAQPHSRVQMHRGASLASRTPPPTIPRTTTETQPSRSNAVAPPPAPSAGPAAPPAPVPAPPAAPTPDQTVEPASKLLGDVQNVADAVGSVPSGSDVQKTAQNATSAVTSVVEQAPTAVVPPGTLPQIGQ